MSTLEDKATALRWLDHGIQLARHNRGENARHSDVIWSLFVEAVTILDHLPDQERSWLTSGTRSGGWSMVGMTPADLREIERIRVLSGIKPFDGASSYRPQSDDVERAMGVLDWMRFVHERRNSKRLVKAALILARNGETDAVHRVYSPNRKTKSRQTIYEIKMVLTGYILAGLSRDLGIDRLDVLAFAETRMAA